MLYQGKRILITGATSGLGKFMALKYAKHGGTIIGIGRDKVKINSLESKLKVDIDWSRFSFLTVVMINRSLTTLLIIAGLVIPTSGFAVTDFDHPVLTGVSVDKTSVDVSSTYQLITVSWSATDATDTAGFEYANAEFYNIKPDGSWGTGQKLAIVNFANSGVDENGAYDRNVTINGEAITYKSNQIIFDSSDFGGNWK